MSDSSQSVLKLENGLSPNRFAGKRVGFPAPVGALILTNKTLIFAAVKDGNLKSLPAIFVPLFATQKVASYLAKIDTEHIEESMKNKGSFSIPLDSITSVSAHRFLGFGASTLNLKYRTVEGEFDAGFGKQVGISGFNSWVEAIEAAKKAL